MKAYDFTVRWGAATNTDDAEGEVIDTAPARPTPDQIAAALPAFTGDIEQIPPTFSAVKIDGERAYARAREGEAVELAARPLYVDSLELTGTPDADHARLSMVCGKGGYVRAIARDLGRSLGCLGHVASLRRTWSGPFTLDQGAVAWSDEIAAETLEAALLPLEAGLSDLPECRCNRLAAGRLLNGTPVEVTRSEADNGDDAWASIDGEAQALGTYRFGHFHPARVFNRGPGSA